jgi:hypothetical protein
MLRRLPLFAIFVAGCAAAPPPAAPPPPPAPEQLPPSPGSVTLDNPGGDAVDAEKAALGRLDREAFGARRDRTNVVLLRLPDARYWRRVTLWGYPTRTAFRYGDAHHAILALWYEPAKGPDDPASCLKRFVDAARPAAEAFGVRAAEVRTVQTLQHGELAAKPMVVELIDADLIGPTGTKSYAGALAAYTSWPGTCLIQGFVVTATHRELASRVRDRWIREAAPRLSWNGRVKETPAFDNK